MEYRWIMYLSQNIPGGLSFTLERVTSLQSARETFRDFCKDMMTPECSATVYAYSEESWTLCQEFRDSGCPLDYPDRIIETGPRGGVVVNNT